MDKNIPDNESKVELIKNFFVDINKDKFTDVTMATAKNHIEWSWEELENKLISCIDARATHELRMIIEYRHKEEIDSIFFTFIYKDHNDGFAGLGNMRLFLILDNTKKLTYDLVSDYKYDSDTVYETSTYYTNHYVEAAQMTIPVQDFFTIAQANSIEYSIRNNFGSLNGTFSKDQLLHFKGFYNSVFDNSYKAEELLEFIKNYKPKPKEESSGGCYIATMAYGSYDHPQVIILRNFRDRYLNRLLLGKYIISCYYSISPSLVRLFKNNTLINKTIRLSLNILIKFFK